MQNLLYNEKQPQVRLYATLLKPLADRVLGGIGLVLALPFMAVIAVLVRTRVGSPIVFKQARAGQNGKTITLYKFRTLINEDDPSDETHFTSPMGRFLRRTHLDKLPHLFNIVRGDLSLIGPRPLLVDYLPLFTPEQARRHNVKPGIMGLAQVNGAVNLKWEEKFSWDTYYVDHMGAALDVKILWRTIVALLSGQTKTQEAPTRGTTVAQSSYIMSDLMNEVLISEMDWNATPVAVRSACQVMANRIGTLDRQLENAHAEREIYRTQMLDMKVRLEAALAMLQLSVPIDTSPDKADTWLDDPETETQPSRQSTPTADETADSLDVLRVVNRVTQDQYE
jgi:sugar transferase EpsL